MNYIVRSRVPLRPNKAGSGGNSLVPGHLSQVCATLSPLVNHNTPRSSKSGSDQVLDSTILSASDHHASNLIQAGVYLSHELKGFDSRSLGCGRLGNVLEDGNSVSFGVEVADVSVRDVDVWIGELSSGLRDEDFCSRKDGSGRERCWDSGDIGEEWDCAIGEGWDILEC